MFRFLDKADAEHLLEGRRGARCVVQIVDSSAEAFDAKGEPLDLNLADPDDPSKATLARISLTIEIMEGPRAGRKIPIRICVKHENAQVQAIGQRAIAELFEATKTAPTFDREALYHKPYIALIRIGSQDPPYLVFKPIPEKKPEVARQPEPPEPERLIISEAMRQKILKELDNNVDGDRECRMDPIDVLNIVLERLAEAYPDGISLSK